MYLCQICHTVTPPRTRRHLLPITRPARYPERAQVYFFLCDGKRYARDDPGGVGWEIEREIVACPDCAAKHTAPALPS